MKTFFLNKVMEWLLGSSFFDRVKTIVMILAGKDLPGKEKRERAQREIVAFGNEAAPFVVNLAIEAAVYLLKKANS